MRAFWNGLAAIVAAGCMMGQASGQEATPANETAATAVPRVIPAAEFVGEAPLSSITLSPDGKMVLGRYTRDGATRVGVFVLAGGMKAAYMLPPKHDLRWIRWAGNNRILISAATTVSYFESEAEATRVWAVDLVTGKFTAVGGKFSGLEGDDILHVSPEGDWLLIGLQLTPYDYPAVYRIDLATGHRSLVQSARDDVWEWFADDAGVVRAGMGFSSSRWSMIYRRTATESFRRLGKVRYDDEDAALDVLRFMRESDEGYALSNKETGRFALYKFNYATKQLGEKVFESPTNDITDFSLDRDGQALNALWYTDDRDRILWFDPVMKQHQADIDKAVGKREAWITSWDRERKTFLIWLGGSNDPGAYYIYRPENGVMNKVLKINEKIKAKELAESRYVWYTARDGLKIAAYLTLPVGRDPRKLPLVILPHGGPYGVRDDGSYDPEVQLLANRGYAVLQPNYRGSDGYGKGFYEQGEGQWGRQMQDDLDDGMDWLVKEGIADSKRVCLVGASYGGYAALWGATRNPDRYRCAASFAGISDLGKQLKYQVNFRISRRYRKDWQQTVKGDEGIDLRTLSPLYTIDKLQVPVLIAHGDADQTVPFKQSSQYAKALQAAGKSVEFYPYADEGHGFDNPDNQRHWLEHLDAFLAKYNPVTPAMVVATATEQ